MANQQNIDLNDFDVKKEFQNLLDCSQDIISEYDILLQKAQSIIETLKPPANSLFNEAIDIAYIKIESKKDSLYLLKKRFTRFDKIYDIKKQLNEYYKNEQEILATYIKLVKKYEKQEHVYKK